jgi:hypothetical protein
MLMQMVYMRLVKIVPGMTIGVSPFVHMRMPVEGQIVVTITYTEQLAQMTFYNVSHLYDCVVLVLFCFEVASIMEQRTCVKFSAKLGETGVEELSR